MGDASAPMTQMTDLPEGDLRGARTDPKPRVILLP